MRLEGHWISYEAISDFVYQLMLPGAILGLLYFAWALAKSIQAADWPTAKGKLAKATLRSRYDSHVRLYRYRPEVEYVYEVDGKRYRRRRLSFGLHGWTISRFMLTRLLREARQSSPHVSVFYNPKNPGQSALVTGFRFHSIPDMLILLGFVAFRAHQLGFLVFI